MDLIYLFTGLCTFAGAVVGLVLICYLERRWLTSKKSRPAESATRGLETDGLST